MLVKARVGKVGNRVVGWAGWKGMCEGKCGARVAMGVRVHDRAAQQSATERDRGDRA